MRYVKHNEWLVTSFYKSGVPQGTALFREGVSPSALPD